MNSINYHFIGLFIFVICITGRQTFLSDGQENRVVRFLVAMSKIGKGISKQDLPVLIKSVLDKAEKDGLVNIENRKFKDNLPSNGWVYTFLKRHPQVSARTPENLGFQRAHINEEGVRSWFLHLEIFLREEHSIVASEFFTDENRNRVFNIDESGFPLHGTAGKCKIIAERGSKNVHRLAPDTKLQITVLACTAGDGKFSNPLVIFPGKKLPKYNLSDVNENDYDLGYSPNGWISSEAFFSWLSSLFYPSIKDKVSFPIIIFMDGHSSHINIAVSEFCRDHKIILYCFPAHASHALQPLDVSVFGPMKRSWNKQVQEFHSKNRVAMTKVHFFSVFDVVWKEACRRPENVKSGFRATGLIPFNVENVNFSKLLDYSAAAKFRLREPKPEELLAGERIGLLRSLAMVKKELDPATAELFKRRYEEGFDLDGEDDENGKLWRIYRNINKCLSFKGNETVPNTIDDAQSPTENEAENMSYVSETDSEKDTSLQAIEQETPSESSRISATSKASFSLASAALTASSKTVTQIPSTSVMAGTSSFEPLPGTSAAVSPLNRRTSTPRLHESDSFSAPSTSTAQDNICDESLSSNLNTSSSFYTNFPKSLFKTYLNISDDVVRNRKTPLNPKVPFAISGKDYNITLKNTQQKKKEEEEAKIQRKNARLAKQNQPKKKAKKSEDKKNPKKSTSHGNDSSSDDEDLPAIQYDDDSEDEMLLEELGLNNTDHCLACDGRDKWTDDKAWIGCNACSGWLHRHCVSKDIERMSEAEIEKITFVCFTCEKKRKS